MKKKRKYQQQKRSQRQRELRKKRGEHAFIFNKEINVCLGRVDREDWEFAILEYGGRVSKAAARCGIPDIPNSAKVLWGTSEEEALRSYRQWRKKQKNLTK